MNLEDIEAARVRITPYIVHTPLIRLMELEERLGSGPIYLKAENFQRTRSFKARGAFNALLSLNSAGRKAGAVSRSSGNFAQALACAGRILGIAVTIVMPENAPRTKIEGTRSQGGTLILHGTTHAEGEEKVAEVANREGKTVLSPFDHLDVIAGQGTAALEIMDDLPDLERYICPIGGGGLMAGTAVAFKARHPAIEVIGVEPAGAADYAFSRETGKRRALASVSTIADGLRAPMVGVHNWPLLNACVDSVTTVEEEEIAAAVVLLYREFGIVAEPSGAVALAALLTMPAVKGDTVCMLSGGNIDEELLLKLTLAG